MYAINLNINGDKFFTILFISKVITYFYSFDLKNVHILDLNPCR
jgi:hypothetical protein